MSAWTGFQFGDAWPYLALGYGLFFVVFGLGFLGIWQHGRRLKQRERILEALKGAKG